MLKFFGHIVKIINILFCVWLVFDFYLILLSLKMFLDGSFSVPGAIDALFLTLFPIPVIITGLFLIFIVIPVNLLYYPEYKRQIKEKTFLFQKIIQRKSLTKFGFGLKIFGLISITLYLIFSIISVFISVAIFNW